MLAYTRVLPKLVRGLNSLYGVKEGEPYVCFDYLAGEIHEKYGELFLKHCTRDAYYEKEWARDAGYTFKNYYLYPEIENG